jgi:mannose-6-phosphate isomerase-like protein (cupin superfamily)
VNQARSAIVLTSREVAERPGQPLGAIDGVINHVLWSDGTSIAGWLTVAGGHQLGVHEHRQNSHHMWILEGSAEILGRELSAGAYVHIPPGTAHDIDATATDGCRVFYLYIR